MQRSDKLCALKILQISHALLPTKLRQITAIAEYTQLMEQALYKSNLI